MSQLSSLALSAYMQLHRKSSTQHPENVNGLAELFTLSSRAASRERALQLCSVSWSPSLLGVAIAASGAELRAGYLRLVWRLRGTTVNAEGNHAGKYG
jgi:hypothetical protein